MSGKLPKATHDGELKFGDITISCAVLEDGRRVLTQEGFLAAIGRAKKAKGGQGASVVDNPPAFLAANNLKSFIPKNLEESTTTPIIFNLKTGGRGYGYPAELLPAVCKVFLDARDAGALLPNQQHIAAKCDILIRGLATVGIIALVDEATGYQVDRDRDALRKILEAYILDQYLPWTKRFPDEYYRQLFRLRRWQYSPPSVKRPQVVGRITNNLVYKQLPPGVLEELRKRNPTNEKGHRSRRFHQYLTEDIGNPHLERHLASVIALMRASANWDTFKRLFARAFSTKPQQCGLFPELEEKNINGEIP